MKKGGGSLESRLPSPPRLLFSLGTTKDAEAGRGMGVMGQASQVGGWVGGAAAAARRGQLPGGRGAGLQPLANRGGGGGRTRSST